MKYYKILHKETGELMCYVESSQGADDVCEMLGADEYVSEEISKEEYEQETEGGAA